MASHTGSATDPVPRRVPTREAWFLQVVLAASSDSRPSLMVVFPSSNRRYLFHAPEGTSRACTQSRISIGVKRLQDVFLPTVETEHAGGLFGLIMSSLEKGKGLMRVHGPVGTAHLLASARLFLKRKDLELQVDELDAQEKGEKDGEWTLVSEDANLAVYALPVSSIIRSSDASQGTASAARKRKSPSCSPGPSAKRTANGLRDLEEHVTERADDNLDWRSSNFKPSSLTGAGASRWRRLVIADMFRLGGGVLLPSDFDGPSTTMPHATGDVDEATKSPQSFSRRPNLSSPAYSRDQLPSLSSDHRWHPDTAISYLGIGPPQRGKFLAQRAKELGVKPGPDFAKLTKGERVKLEGEDRWVEPEDCMEDGETSSAFLIATCPTLDHIPHLAAYGFKDSVAGQRSPLKGAVLKVVVHVAGPGVLEDERYQTWMRDGFSASAQHFVGSAEHSPDHPTFGPAALQQLRLSRLSSDNFPLPYYSLTPQRSLPFSILPLVHGQCIQLTDAGMRAPEQNQAHIRRFDFPVPSEAADREMATLKTTNEPEKEQQKGKKAWTAYLEAVKQVKAEVQRLQEERSAQADLHGGPADGLLLTSLGTGSAIPSKYRNVSATLVRLTAEDGFVLLDCGEGTLGQIRRCFGPRSIDVLAKLRLIFLSHLHADHHTGLTALLVARRKEMGRAAEKVVLVAPFGAWLHLRERSDIEDLGLDSVIFVDANRLLRLPAEEGKTADGIEAQRQRAAEATLAAGLPRLEIQTVVVPHAGRCFGVVIKHRDQGWKLVYSGDTRPHDGLIEAGLDADLLIHEATIDDSMPDLADFKGHSTIGQAIRVAQRMRARKCLLTHFSARYPKIPPMLMAPNAPTTVVSPFVSIIALAFDTMSLRVGDMWKLAKFLPALEALFSDGEEETDVAHLMDDMSGDVKRPVAPGSEASQQQITKQQRREAWEKQQRKKAKAKK